MIKLFVIISCICLFLMSAWFLLPRFLEQPKYKVIKKEGYFEVRSYSNFIISSVLVSGSQYNSLRKGFRPLVKYISGKDRGGEKISMTAPVIQATTETEGNFKVSFSMPSKYRIDNLPKSENTDITFEEVQPSIAAVVWFRGKAKEEILVSKTNQLNEWIIARGYTAISKPKYLFYNDPSTPGFLRRNEVLVIVEK